MAGPIPEGTEPVVEPAAALSSPLADKISEQFNDPALAAQVDAFWREHSQPYVTGLETQLATMKEADEFVQAMKQSPGQAWFDLTYELLGDEVATKLVATLQDADATPTTTQEDTPVTDIVPGGVTSPPVTAALTPEDAELLAEVRAERQMTQYNNAISSFAEDKADLKPYTGIFSPFVAAADGDLDAAYAGFQRWHSDAFPTAGDEGAAAPPTLAGDAPPAIPAAATQTTARMSLEDAIHEVTSMMRPAAPPTVGSI